jgi:hypothetical protein
VVTDRHACLTAADNDSLDLLAHEVKIGVGPRSGIAEITHPSFTAMVISDHPSSSGEDVFEGEGRGCGAR